MWPATGSKSTHPRKQYSIVSIVNEQLSFVILIDSGWYLITFWMSAGLQPYITPRVKSCRGLTVFRRRKFVEEAGVNQGEEALINFNLSLVAARRDMAMLGLLHRTVIRNGLPHFRKQFQVEARKWQTRERVSSDCVVAINNLLPTGWVRERVPKFTRIDYEIAAGRGLFQYWVTEFLLYLINDDLFYWRVISLLGAWVLEWVTSLLTNVYVYYMICSFTESLV